MTKFIPYMAKEAIERDAEALLAEFARARDVVIEPPIPIEDIVEKHLKLGIEFDDTHDLFGIPRTGLDLGQGPDILGAMFFDEKSSSTKASIPRRTRRGRARREPRSARRTRRGRAVIALPWHMREAATGGFTVPFMPGTLHRQPNSAGHPSHPSSAGQFRQMCGSNGRRISMRPAS